MGIPYAEVIGDPIAHSKSPLIHKFWLEKLGLKGDYRRCHVRANELENYLSRRLEDPEWRGCNVTMPHKQAVLNLVDYTDVLSVLDAANTLAPRRQRLYAWNTDITGIMTPLSRYPFPTDLMIDEPGSSHVSVSQIIGAGGAAQAALHAVHKAGYLHIEIFNRTTERARETAARADVSRSSAYPLSELRPLPGGASHPFNSYHCHYLIINASTMGMTGYPSVPIDLRAYPADTIVFDMVYAPVETPLLRAARDCGLRIIDGLEMLVAQAAFAFAIFFFHPAPREHDAELRALLVA